MIGRGAAVGLAAVLALAVVPTVGAGPATAEWGGSWTGSGSVTATTVERGAAPEVRDSGTTVQLAWEPSLLATGAPVGGYDVYRHAADGSRTLVCSTTEPVRACEDDDPRTGATGYGVVPRIGLHWTGPESPLTGYTRDTTAPQTSFRTAPEPNGAGWHRDSVEVTLQATDATGQVAAVRYRLGGGPVVEVPGSTATFTVPAEGTTTVTFHATDTAGNVEAEQSRVVRVDRTAPARPELLSMSDDSGVSSTDRITNVPTVTLGGRAEPGSAVTVSGGAQAVTVTADGQGGFTAAVPLAEGARTLTAVATDVAGNASPASSGFPVTLDRVAPALTVTDPRAGVTYNNRTQGQGSNRWSQTCAAKPGACGTAADPGSGLVGLGMVLRDTVAGTCWTGSGTTWSTAACGTPLTVTGTASWSRGIDYAVVAGRQLTLTVTGSDVAGNVATQQVAFRAE